jgi:hypothetical protein
MVDGEGRVVRDVEVCQGGVRREGLGRVP